MKYLRLFAAFAAISLATRWLSLVVEVIDVDEACHIVGAWMLARGRLLYTDFVDNKPPFLYVYYALAQLIAGRGLIAVHAVTAAVVIPLTALGIVACFGPTGIPGENRTRTGIVAAVVFLIYSASYIGHDMLASNAEVVMILPATWAIVLLRHPAAARSASHRLLAGLLFGTAMLVKPHIATWLVACVIAVGHWDRRPARAIGELLVGAAIPLVATLGYFAARGGAGALIHWLVGESVGYVANPIGAREAVGRATASLLPFLLVTLPLWWAWLRGERRTLASLLVIASIPPVLAGLRFFPHYFIQLYVPLALAAAPKLEGVIFTRPMTAAGRLVLGWTAVVLAGFSIANAVLYLGSVNVYRERSPAYRAVADRLLADPCAPGASLFVWGWAPIIYYDAPTLPPASRFVALGGSRLTGYVPGNLESASSADAAQQESAEHWDWLMNDLDRSGATFIVDTAPANIYRWGRYPVKRYPRLQTYLQRDFDLVDTVQQVRIYRRRGCAAMARE
jgi:hypothetical protein